jgi:hypothetical protein
MSSGHLPPSYASTRESLHRLAEHVLSPARYAASGKIGLRSAPGGFATPAFGDADRVIAVDGDHIVVTEQRRAPQPVPARRTAITTIADAARFVGITPGAPASVYQPNTPLELDAPLAVDVDAAEVIAMWYELAAKALRAFAGSIADDDPSEAQLWPEHFDLALTADRINYGGSPGDDHIDVPYLYIGPFEGPPQRDAFWNQPFGAAFGFDEIASIDDAFEFFRRGRRLTRESR